MRIHDRNENEICLKKVRIPFNDLKKTENKRYLCVLEQTVETYKVKIRISFAELTEERRELYTEHFTVQRYDRDTFDFTAKICTADFRQLAESIDRCSYTEKSKGINVKCKIDRYE